MVRNSRFRRQKTVVWVSILDAGTLVYCWFASEASVATVKYEFDKISTAENPKLLVQSG